MFILKKITDLNLDSEEFKSEEKGVVNNFSPFFTIATNKNSTSVVFSITHIIRVVIFSSSGETETHRYNKKYYFNLKKRIFLNDKNIKAYFYSSKKEKNLSNKKIKKFFY